MINSWLLQYRIPLQADDAMDSLDDHLKIEGESCLYEVSIYLKAYLSIIHLSIYLFFQAEDSSQLYLSWYVHFS